MSAKPPDPSVDELKKGAAGFLVPRIAIGLLLLVITALYIFWPR